MTSLVENPWADETDDNVWNDDNEIERQRDIPTDTSNVEVEEVHEKTGNEELEIKKNSQEENDRLDCIIDVVSPEDEISIWGGPNMKIQADNGIIKEEEGSIIENEEDEIPASMNSIENALSETDDNAMAGDFEEDEFGDFEELPINSLIFDKPINELVLNIFADNDAMQVGNMNEYSGKIDKSNLLVNGGIKPMKCYNTIVSSDRQYLANDIEILNTRRRGCIENMVLYKEVVRIASGWIADEKGVDDLSSIKVWKKNNIFRWSTKTDPYIEVNKDDTKELNMQERKQVGKKLLNASFEQSRRIIEERQNNEKKDRMQLEKVKWEREQILKKEKLKKEEELAKYQLEPLGVTDKKKKGFFGKMFSGKSNIAKDHISHTKVIVNTGDNVEVSNKDISLKEQLERDGYDLSNSTGKGGKGRKFMENQDEDDDDNDDEDDDGDSFDFDINGYNVLDSNAEIGTENAIILNGENNLDKSAEYSSDGDFKGKEVPVNGNSFEKDDNHFGSFDHGYNIEVKPKHAGNSNDDNDNNKSNDDTFDEFQTFEVPSVDIEATPTSDPHVVFSHDDGNLVDL